MPRRKSTGPDPIDVHVGARVKLRRTILGISQTAFGKPLGVTFQQIQKYEKGTNRIGASRLYRMAEILDVPVSFFFDGYAERTPASGEGLSPDALAIAGMVEQLPSPKVRATIRAFIQSLAKSSAQAAE